MQMIILDYLICSIPEQGQGSRWSEPSRLEREQTCRSEGSTCPPRRGPGLQLRVSAMPSLPDRIGLGKSPQIPDST